MPPFISARPRAGLTTLALLASATTITATAAAETAQPALPAVAGGASLEPTPITTTPVATTPAPVVETDGRLVHILARQLTFASGSTVSLRAQAGDAPVVATLRIGSGGRAVATAKVAAGRSFRLQASVPRGTELHLTAHRTDGVSDRDDVTVGTVRRLRQTVASWYGPGLYGNRTACGQTLTPGLRGVAHKSLPCGTQLTVKFHGRSVRATVVDRGPYVGGREFDLTNGTAKALGFRHVGRVWVSAS